MAVSFARTRIINHRSKISLDRNLLQPIQKRSRLQLLKNPLFKNPLIPNSPAFAFTVDIPNLHSLSFALKFSVCGENWSGNYSFVFGGGTLVVGMYQWMALDGFLYCFCSYGVQGSTIVPALIYT